MSSRPVSIFITIIMDLLVILAVALTVRACVVFFGQLSAQGWGKAVIALTERLVIPFGVSPIKTPYGGRFEVVTALTIGVVLLIEWVLSSLRERA